jgi:hypothetical protein
MQSSELRRQADMNSVMFASDNDTKIVTSHDTGLCRVWAACSPSGTPNQVGALGKSHASTATTTPISATTRLMAAIQSTPVSEAESAPWLVWIGPKLSRPTTTAPDRACKQLRRTRFLVEMPRTPRTTSARAQPENNVRCWTISPIKELNVAYSLV